MPRKEIDYSNTHFYKIVCKDLNIKDCYVGHTTNFKNKKYEHIILTSMCLFVKRDTGTIGIWY